MRDFTKLPPKSGNFANVCTARLHARQKPLTFNYFRFSFRDWDSLVHRKVVFSRHVAPIPRTPPISNRRTWWLRIGPASVVLIAIAVVVFLKLRNAHPPLPDIEDIQSIEANFYDTGRHAKVTFQVPRQRIGIRSFPRFSPLGGL